MSEYEYDRPADDGKMLEKDAALRLALTRLSNEFGRESMLSLRRFFGSRHAPVISTGSLKLDLALGTGGLPKVISYNDSALDHLCMSLLCCVFINIDICLISILPTTQKIY